MTAGSGMKNIQALIPNVGNGEGGQCGRDHTMSCCVGRTCVCEIESNITRTEREREREREAQRGITLLAEITMNNQPLQKVTKSLYIVTHLGQLRYYANYRNGPNLGYQRG